MNKVVRIGLICDQKDSNGNEIDYKLIFQYLWELQNQTREIKNKTVQMCWEFMNESQVYFKEHGTYPKEKDGRKFDNYIYEHLKQGVDLYSGNINATIRAAKQAFDDVRKEILRGDRSILSYKKNQPLELHNKTIALFSEGKDYYAKINLFNVPFTQKNGYPSTTVQFQLQVCDNSQKTIVSRCIAGDYKITASKLIYNEKKRRWMLNLGYSFQAEQVHDLDPERILGVDLGTHLPICASVYNEYPRFIIPVDQIEEYRKRTEKRKIALQHQGKYCGDGRIGHGRDTRCQPIDKIEDRIARFRDTFNHSCSRSLIEYAIKHRCGVIQMEDLTGIADNADRYLKNWSYFDLQTKIEYKAKEVGIKVVKINPKYTSQRCSHCGYIDRENRPTQANFKCLNCGFEDNADHNASQNIALKDIEKIIQKQLACEDEANTKKQ